MKHDINQQANQHQWASDGVSTYPLTHPIVGQGTFYHTFKQFIHVVDQEADRFAHVFGIIAQWGIGKSRLAYELISQINGTSRGWYVRDEKTNALIQANLFNDDADREQYLGLYIRYSQIANEHHNIDNWFGYGLYKALLPLARGEFDGSIQNSIAKEAFDRLLASGFASEKLAAAMELDKNYSDAALYEDDYLVTRLCQAAYDYLQQFGIKYILVALDELETVAETSTYGLEQEDIKHMDGKAIKLLGKAIKEEDPRRKLPWLRYVALCSPAIGDELREIQSTARRFELVDLAQNAFADVSDFVRTLADTGRLDQTYPNGLVEAAYTMSGGNFGWFNVIMANVDGVLRKPPHNKTTPKLGQLFDELVKSSSRVRDHVLDYNAITELRLPKEYLPIAKELLYGQLPVPLSHFSPEERQALLNGQNEYNESIALYYRQVNWDELACSDALRKEKFKREQETWKLAGVDRPLNLRQLLDNLSTYAIYAQGETTSLRRTSDGKRILLIPLYQSEFIQLLNFLYPHPASEYAARALWKHLMGSNDILEADATHIAPGMAMLERLDLRYRKQNQTSLIFRDPDHSNAHEQAMTARKQQPPSEKNKEILTGIMRVLDRNWQYDPISTGLASDYVTVATPRRSQGYSEGGLVTCDALKLHPKGRAIFAWIQNEQELKGLCGAIATQFKNEGKTPILAFTTSKALLDRFQQSADPILKKARSYLLLHQLSTNEEYALHRVGLAKANQEGFQLQISNFNSAFTGRLNAFERALAEEIHRWRRTLHQEGYIAYPLRPRGTLKPDEKNTLFTAWRYLLLQMPSPHALYQLDKKSGVDLGKLSEILGKLKLSEKMIASGYGETEKAQLFDGSESDAQANFPAFLVNILFRLVKEKQSWSIEAAEQEWFWGYLWEGAKAKEIFTDWLTVAVELGFTTSQKNNHDPYEFLERSSLKGRIQEAQNWLDRDYTEIVEKMRTVFGEGEINDLFGESGSKKRVAQENLAIANECLKQLDVIESNYPDLIDFEKLQDKLIESAKHRLKLLKAVNDVYDLTQYNNFSEENLKTLDFRNDSEPLWQRIRRAELFSDRVLSITDQIQTHIETLSKEMKDRVSTLSHFPTQLFIRSLEKIRNILDGALRVPNLNSSTADQQMESAGALGQCLKDLRVGDAMNRLGQLGREVGIDVEDPRLTAKPLAEIDGQIITTFRRFQEVYHRLHTDLQTAQTQIEKLAHQLIDAPDDFHYPSGIESLEGLKTKSDSISEALFTIQQEEVDALFEDDSCDRPAKQGNFLPLMQAAEQMINSPNNTLRQLNSSILTLENALRGYLKTLVDAPGIQNIEKALNAILKARGQKIRPTLTLLELEKADSLKVAVTKLQERRTDWVAQGNHLLPNDIKFERWQRIVETIEQGQEPQLESREADLLVGEGLLVRTYRLGGSQ